MDLRRIKSILQSNIRNIQGWHTNRRIIVIESDDWGSIRMPSRKVYNNLLNAGIRVDHCPYNRFDSIESESDLLALFNGIKKFKDFKGNHPVITTNFVTANPDFQKIKDSGYQDYHYELFTDTYKRNPKHHNTFTLIREGMREKYIYPQFHGREHLNVNRWMTALRQNLPETRFTFKNRLFGISTNITSEMRRSYMSAFDFDNIDEIDDHRNILNDGLRLFENIFGYKSKTFIATNYCWHSLIEETLKNNGVNFIQGSYNQIEPSGGNKSPKIISHRLGRFNKFGQMYLVRNAFFEPSLLNTVDPVAYCINNIEIAFRWGKPAIVSSHRVNFIGSIVKENRENNIILFIKLLKQIRSKWKDIEFMNSEQLGDLIYSDIIN